MHNEMAFLEIAASDPEKGNEMSFTWLNQWQNIFFFLFFKKTSSSFLVCFSLLDSLPSGYFSKAERCLRQARYNQCPWRFSELNNTTQASGVAFWYSKGPQTRAAEGWVLSLSLCSVLSSDPGTNDFGTVILWKLSRDWLHHCLF